MEFQQSLIWLGINFGFAAVIAVILLVMYQKLVGALADLIKANTSALVQLKAAIDGMVDRLDRLERK